MKKTDDYLEKRMSAFSSKTARGQRGREKNSSSEDSSSEDEIESYFNSNRKFYSTHIHSPSFLREMADGVGLINCIDAYKGESSIDKNEPIFSFKIPSFTGRRPADSESSDSSSDEESASKKNQKMTPRSVTRKAIRRASASDLISRSVPVPIHIKPPLSGKDSPDCRASSNTVDDILDYQNETLEVLAMIRGVNPHDIPPEISSSKVTESETEFNNIYIPSIIHTKFDGLNVSDEDPFQLDL